MRRAGVGLMKNHAASVTNAQREMVAIHLFEFNFIGDGGDVKIDKVMDFIRLFCHRAASPLAGLNWTKLPTVKDGIRSYRDILLGIHRENPDALSTYGFTVTDSRSSGEEPEGVRAFFFESNLEIRRSGVKVKSAFELLAIEAGRFRIPVLRRTRAVPIPHG